MDKHVGPKLIVVCDENGRTGTYVVRETDSQISIEAAIDPRTSAATCVREMVSLVTAILPNGPEKFYMFKVLRLVEEGIDGLRDRMEADTRNDLDELPF